LDWHQGGEYVITNAAGIALGLCEAWPRKGEEAASHALESGP
jgi:hypothetical protein